MLIQDLPPELLSQIFESGLPPYTDFDSWTFGRRQKFLALICLISRLWEDVAYGTPSLWSLFVLDYNEALPAEEDYGLRKYQLERAKNTMLDIILRYRIQRGHQGRIRPGLWGFWQVLKEKHAQWRSLRVDRVPTNSLTEFERIFPRSLPSLIDFKTALLPSIPPRQRAIDAPRLRRYEGHSNFFPFTSTNNLEFLRVTHSISEKFQVCPGLHTLHIDMPLVSTLPVTLPPLRHLRLSSISHGDQVVDFLKNLTAPDLRTISVLNFLSFQPHHPQERPDSTPIIFPASTAIRFGFGDLRQIACIRAIIERLGSTASIVLRLSSPVVMFSQHGLLASEVADVDGAFGWLQNNMKDVIWINEGDPVEDCLANWWELRSASFGTCLLDSSRQSAKTYLRVYRAPPPTYRISVVTGYGK